MENISQLLNKYTMLCQEVFGKYKLEYSHVIPMEHTTINFEPIINKAINEVENSEEFSEIAFFINHRLINKDIKRLVNDFQDTNIVRWSIAFSKKAAHNLFYNSGAYSNIWQNNDYDISILEEIIYNQKFVSESKLIKLFVFDGFILFDSHKERNRVKNIELPFGKLLVYDREDIEKLIQPHREIHLPPETIDELNRWHILTIEEEEKYRGPGTLYYEELVYLDLNEILVPKREGNIDFIGPIFLFIGEDANLAEEIIIRSNIFDSSPITRNIRNGYLAWEPSYPNGDDRPKRYITYAGKDGDILRRFCELWLKLNKLDKEGFLKYPTELFVRCVMNLHRRDELANIMNPMDMFVNLITIIESLLAPDGPGDLRYKISIRCASLFSDDPGKRRKIFDKIYEFYDIRSKIVHEGHSKGISLDYKIIELFDIVHNLFLKYLVLLHLLINNKIEYIDFEIDLSSKTKRKNILPKLLNLSVLNNEVSTMIQKEAESFGLQFRRLVL